MTSSTLVPEKDAHEEALPTSLQIHTVTPHTPPPVTATSSNSLAVNTSIHAQPTQQSDKSKKFSDEILTFHDLLNYFGRWVENGRFFGLLPVAIIDKTVPVDNAQFHQQLEDTIDKISGLIIATFFHIFFKSKYKKIKSINPLYRNFKTLAAAGTQVGIIFADIRSFPQALSVSIFALGIGIVALPYWFYREYKTSQEEKVEDNKIKLTLKDHPECEEILNSLREKRLEERLSNRNKYTRTGNEGWSKYSKTALVYGMYVGEVVGTITSFFMRSDTLRNITIYGAFGSVVAFAIGVIAVPVINVLSNNKLVANTKDGFRNNYVRSGITLGIAVGAVLGCIISLFIPGAGIIVAMAIGSAFGSVIGGIILGVHGYKITQYLQNHWKVIKNTDNSWDYATRNLSYFGGFACAASGFLIGCLIPVPGAALIGSAIGTAVGGTFGWVSGLILISVARMNSEEEYPAVTLPWTQRIANGTMVGSMIGAAIGLCIGLIGGPVLAVSGATLGFSLGAVIGGLAFGLYDQTARALIRKAVTGVLILPPSVKANKTPEQELANLHRTNMDPIEMASTEERNPLLPTEDKHIQSESSTLLMNRSFSSNDEKIQDSPEPVTSTVPRRAASYPSFLSRNPGQHDVKRSKAPKNDSAVQAIPTLSHALHR